MLLDEFTRNDIYEMSNFGHRTTGLPSHIEVWVRTETNQLPHSNYRIKIEKHKEYSAIFSVGIHPEILKSSHKNKLSTSEVSGIKKFISKYSSLIIGHIDGKLDSGELAIEIQKLRGEE